MIPRILSVIAGICLMSCAKEQVPDAFFRIVQNDDSRLALETATVSIALENGAEVTLVSVVHLGTPEYYEEIAGQLLDVDTVLYELLGKNSNSILPPLPETSRDSFWKRRLGLVRQGRMLDYRAEKFVHADLGDLEMAPFLEEPERQRNERLQDILLADITPEERRYRLLSEPELLQKVIGSSVEQGDRLAEARHARVLEVLESALQNDSKRIAILYGASHMSAIAELISYTSVKRSSWITAWPAGAD